MRENKQPSLLASYHFRLTAKKKTDPKKPKNQKKKSILPIDPDTCKSFTKRGLGLAALGTVGSPWLARFALLHLTVGAILSSFPLLFHF